MSFTNEQILKAKAAKSVEELLALAKENGVELTEDEAKKYFAEWHDEGELSDDELANVSGGCGTPNPRFSVGDRIYYYERNGMAIGIKEDIWKGTILEVLRYDKTYGWHYLIGWDEHKPSEASEDHLSPL